MAAEVPHHLGLCPGCRHARAVLTPRSRFWLCERSRNDASFPRYPRLPVLECRGFEPGEPVPADVPQGPQGSESGK